MERSDAGFNEDLIIFRDDDGVAFAVPRTAMERFRMTPERRAWVAALLEEETAAAGCQTFARESLPEYEVATAELAPYRLSREEWTRLEALLHGDAGDVRGYNAGRRLPSWVVAAPGGQAAHPAHVHTFPAWYWFAGGGGDQSSRANVSA